MVEQKHRKSPVQNATGCKLGENMRLFLGRTPDHLTTNTNHVHCVAVVCYCVVLSGLIDGRVLSLYVIVGVEQNALVFVHELLLTHAPVPTSTAFHTTT